MAESPSVLIVDDDDAIAELFELWLSDGFDVHIALGGEAALEALTDEFDVLVLDWRMPEVSGAEVVNSLGPEAEDCGVILVSGIDIAEELPSAVDRVLQKPVDREELVESVSALATAA